MPLSVEERREIDELHLRIERLEQLAANQGDKQKAYDEVAHRAAELDKEQAAG